MTYDELVVFLFLSVSMGGPFAVMIYGLWHQWQYGRLPEEEKRRMARERIERTIEEYRK